ncbi:MAG: NAD-dependent epimerase/dehydratase family protein [Dehalococcoidia bacterium]|nr:MAG: NAD-dependent epimerase/dehydratase family protein [Dehalococcoidia bacterium]
MKVFITGATGFIGTHVVRRLAETQHAVCCFVREKSDVREIEKIGATLVTGDLTDEDSLIVGMRGCDWLVNLAACTSYRQQDKQVHVDVNVGGTLNVLQAALQTGITKVVHISPATVYGAQHSQPFTEEAPLGSVPRGGHTTTKCTADMIAWHLYEKKGLPLVSVYPGYVIGPDDSKPSTFYRKSISVSEMATRRNQSIITFIHVKDVAEAIIRALENGSNIGEKYLLGKYALSYHELDDLIFDVCGTPSVSRHLPYCVVKAIAALLTGMKMWFDGSKAERELGIEYSPIRDALEEAIASHDELLRHQQIEIDHGLTDHDHIPFTYRYGLRVLESIPSYDSWS